MGEISENDNSSELLQIEPPLLSPIKKVSLVASPEHLLSPKTGSSMMLQPEEVKALLDSKESSEHEEEAKAGSPNPLLASVTLQTLDSQLLTKGSYFNIMVCGAAGIGKSSFADLFIKKFNFREASSKLNMISPKVVEQTAIKPETT